jgi:hypothetical protein
MALNHSPKIVTDGLVFYYDMNNTEKSWKGKPTTNYVITTVENYTGWGGAGWWIHPGNTVTTNYAPLPTGGMGTVFCATTLGTGGLYGYNGYALSTAYSSGTQYSLSFWAKSYIGAPTITVRDADSGGALSYSFSGIDATWRKFSITWYANTSSNMLTFTGSNFCLYGVQFEISSFASPFVNGTRSTTQAILDLTGQNTITASSLTYASDGTFSFNGSGNNLSIGSFGGYSTNITCEAWFKTTSSATWKNIVCGPTGDVIFTINGNLVNFGCQGSTPIPHLNYSTTTVNTGNWFHAAATYDGTYVKIYVNGVLESTTARTGNITPGAKNIGSSSGGGSEYFNGTIGNVKIYNRVLNDTEVNQNFQALRGRYGV